VVDADAGPGERVALPQPALERRPAGVSGALGGAADPLVLVAVGVGDRAARRAHVLLDGGARGGQLAVELGVGQGRQMGVRAGVRRDLPPAVAQGTELVPGQRRELLAVLALEPVVDARPDHRRAGRRPVGGDEDRRRHAQALEDRRREGADRAVGVVERDDHGAPRRAPGDGVGEGRPAVAAPGEQRQLALERLGRDRELRVPRRADRVVAEDEDIAHTGAQ
jgi:hypothetical protein